MEKSAEELWQELSRAAQRQDYVAAYRTLKDLDQVLQRRCRCGRLAMQDGPRCSVCWSRTPECGRVVQDVLKGAVRALEAVERVDLESRVVAEVSGDDPLPLPSAGE